jgi:hypothetical protein
MLSINAGITAGNADKLFFQAAGFHSSLSIGFLAPALTK